MKTVCCKSVIFPAFIYDPYQPVSFRFFIRNDTVQLADFKRGFVTFIIEAYRKMPGLILRFFHC